MKQPEDIEIRALKIGDDGSIPNNPDYPLLVYKNVAADGDKTEKILHEHNWLGSWRGKVYTEHHYHSNTHEVLVVDAGQATLHLGGQSGEKVTVEKGDALILPAGFGHKYLEGTDDFAVIGAYPDDREHDFLYGKPEERPQNLENIREVPLPAQDPLFGADGPLFEYWK
ncbi:hypothetical protein WN59_09585 [Salinicoccus sediminis]|uniref:Cupin type-2 domain-containing protein n=2 Tax=Salinicoccus sediminis TaxID=1432562 RepID=A0A0M2SJM8_9STAP|nr:cupin domain-containing protein [Salinicoccus sediminis]KKK33856.1 hypothetical protein WN59_09585 [Salinicoccus sediminis]